MRSFVSATDRHIPQVMNHSLVSADSTTHLKIVVLALIGAIAVVMVGIASHQTQAGHLAPMVKAGKPSSYSSQDRSTVR